MPEWFLKGEHRLHFEDDYLYLGGLLVGEVIRPTPQQLDSPLDPPWFAWISTRNNEMGVGWFATEQEAREALVDLVTEKLYE